MLWCALAPLIWSAGPVHGAHAEVVQGAVADVRRLPSGDVQVALDQGRQYLIARTAAVTCDGRPAFFDTARKYAGGLAATLTLAPQGARSAVRVEFSSSAAQTPAPSFNGSSDALDEVNAARARRGLPPYLKDEGLTQAAARCAQLRAASFIDGHLGGQMSDFACLPPGCQASATGAGALTPDWGWGSCCTYDGYAYAGAAWVMGADGRRYMSLFVR
jgi:hypothetical protein